MMIVGESMESRVNKYNENDYSVSDEGEFKSRSSKNQELYQNIGSEEIDNIAIKANSSVLTNDVHNINIAQVRDMLDKKYRDEYDRKTINIPDNSDIADVEYEKTREYDINQILNSAKNENQKNDYNEERLKKLRDTQFDILKNLDMQKADVTPEASDPQSMGLMELINTITEKELTTTEVDPLDILSDLKGDESTKIINTDSITTELAKDSTASTSEMTDSMEFNNNDFDDFNDITKSKSNRIIVIIIITLLGIGFAAGLFVLLNYVLGWGLF